MSDTTLSRAEIIIQGTVQGVGFRPFVYRLARQNKVFGTIFNNDQGVIIEAEAARATIRDFIKNIHSTLPPLARITSLQQEWKSPQKGFTDFTILPSVCSKPSHAMIPADIALCRDCLRDITEPGNRRFSYPFTNCTNCGPRFTIVESIPYDRPMTSMKSFPLCPACRAEYEDPENRRFHAQPNACPVCGPSLTFHDAMGKQLLVSSPLQEISFALCQGKIAAMRGLGGFHLMVDAHSEWAVNRLRNKKGRKSKPLAVMTKNLESAASFCQLSQEAEELLSGTEHPIVLLPRKENGLARSLTPNIDIIGVMLPYTPLHSLLFTQEDCPQTLVMTSGNRSGAPIFTDSMAGVAGLREIADCFLLHNREIVTRVDDSVVKITSRGPQLLRRARGYVPSATPLDNTLPPLLACGAGLKSTFCLTRGQSAFLSQHIGDLFNLESLDFYKESIDHLTRLLQVEPEAVVCDLHPDYLSSHFARETGLPLYRVQHHHAHAAAVIAEHNIQGKVLALILDGSGLGDDNSLWGGEVLEADCSSYTRLGSLTSMLLPGGDAAAEEPWRMALSLLYTSGCNLDNVQLDSIEKTKQQALWQMMKQGFNCPSTTSCGRFFDGVAAILGVCLKADYEGQAAIELEALANQALGKQSIADLLASCSPHTNIIQTEQRLVLQQEDLLSLVLKEKAAGRETAKIALDFHLCLIKNLFTLLLKIAQQTRNTTVVLSGGCMQNSLLLEGLIILLEQVGFSVYTGQNIPVNDAGISLGQAVIGGLRHVSGSTNESA